MKRHIPALHHLAPDCDRALEGLFLVRFERAFYRWDPQKPFFALRLAILEPQEHAGRRSRDGSIARRGRCGS